MRIRYKTSLLDDDVEDAFAGDEPAMEVDAGIQNILVLEKIIIADLQHIINRRPNTRHGIDEPISVHIENVGLFVVSVSCSLMNKDLIGEIKIGAPLHNKPIETTALKLPKE